MKARCDYCNREVNKPIKIGPKLKYCDYNCYAADCITKYQGTSLANGIARMYPEIAAKLSYANEYIATY